MKIVKSIIGLCLGLSVLFVNTSIADVVIPPPGSEATLKLETTVEAYMTAWKKQDFATMLTYEDWAGGNKLTLVQYIQSFEANYNIQDWKVMRMQDVENNEYKVLILVRHSPPKQVAAFLPEGKMVKSTRYQWWQKQGDKFVHLYHIETKKLIELLIPPHARPKPADK